MIVREFIDAGRASYTRVVSMLISFLNPTKLWLLEKRAEMAALLEREGHLKYLQSQYQGRKRSGDDSVCPMAAVPFKDPVEYPLDPIQCHDKAAPTHEDNSVNLKDHARHLITLRPKALSPTSVVLDNACGPGTVTGEIFANLPPESLPQTIYATDDLAKMIEMLNKKKAGGTQWDRVKSSVVDSRDLNIF